MMRCLMSEQNAQSNSAKDSPYEFWTKTCLKRAASIRAIRRAIKEQRR